MTTVGQLVDERTAAQRLGVSVAFLRADRYRGHVGGRSPGPPWYQVGRAIRYDMADLEQWLATRRVDRTRATTSMAALADPQVSGGERRCGAPTKTEQLARRRSGGAS